MIKKDPAKYLTKKYPLQYGVGNPLLRTVCDPIDLINPDVVEFSLALAELMREYDGVGLSGPQVGVTERIIAVTNWKNGKRNAKCTGQTVMINPIIVKQSDKMVVSEEGCLSLPGQYGKVLRHQHVTVQFLTPQGKQQQEKFKGFNAAIVQHEIDHLDGILFVDKLIQ